MQSLTFMPEICAYLLYIHLSNSGGNQCGKGEYHDLLFLFKWSESASDDPLAPIMCLRVPTVNGSAYVVHDAVMSDACNWGNAEADRVKRD